MTNAVRQQQLAQFSQLFPCRPPFAVFHTAQGRYEDNSSQSTNAGASPWGGCYEALQNGEKGCANGHLRASLLEMIYSLLHQLLLQAQHWECSTEATATFTEIEVNRSVVCEMAQPQDTTVLLPMSKQAETSGSCPSDYACH
ncbi:hypothetical protein Q7C36_011427 [Tachysurus vachellii]|uniref:Uncharacterized protein n=1 Tax=Tachysurus vachellii TaxID=175792 RepID=A0AA88SP09_TACVA|nr:hypothetical protein Q7C36_011427 [Tachysurus vachellii]